MDILVSLFAGARHSQTMQMLESTTGSSINITSHLSFALAAFCRPPRDGIH